MILKTKFPVKVRDTLKIENKNSISISVFGYKEKDQIYLSKKISKKKHVDLLLIGKKNFILIKDFHTFMYIILYIVAKKHFCCCLQAFSTEEILKC